MNVQTQTQAHALAQAATPSLVVVVERVDRSERMIRALGPWLRDRAVPLHCLLVCVQAPITAWQVTSHQPRHAIDAHQARQVQAMLDPYEQALSQWGTPYSTYVVTGELVSTLVEQVASRPCQALMLSRERLASGEIAETRRVAQALDLPMLLV